MLICLKYIPILLGLLLFLGSNSFIISVENIEENNRPLLKYDSLTNFPLNPKILIGQSIIVPDVSEQLQINGYNGFYSDIEQMTTYQPCEKNPSATKYETIKKKYLKVLDVIKKDLNQYLKLQDFNNEQFYYQYPKSKDDWIFTVEGYYEKLDKRLVDTKFIARREIELSDYKYNKPIKVLRGEQLTVKGLFVRRPHGIKYSTICIIFKLPDRNHIIVPYNCIDLNTTLCMVDDLEKTALWLGYFESTDVRKEYWGHIIEEKIVKGMHPIECELSLGIPYKIHSIEKSDSTSKEWWIYPNSKVLFENGELMEFRYNE